MERDRETESPWARHLIYIAPLHPGVNIWVRGNCWCNNDCRALGKKSNTGDDASLGKEIVSLLLLHYDPLLIAERGLHELVHIPFSVFVFPITIIFGRQVHVVFWCSHTSHVTVE